MRRSADAPLREHAAFPPNRRTRGLSALLRPRKVPYWKLVVIVRLEFQSAPDGGFHPFEHGTGELSGGGLDDARHKSGGLHTWARDVALTVQAGRASTAAVLFHAAGSRFGKEPPTECHLPGGRLELIRDECPVLLGTMGAGSSMAAAV